MKNKTIFYYSFLALPLAFIGLPIYVYLQKIYNEEYGLPLALIGAIILITRLLDFVLDPYIGIMLDRLNLKKIYRKKIIYLVLPLLAISFNFLIFPPFAPAYSLFIFSLTTYLLYTIVIINYYAISVELTNNCKLQNKISGAREAMGVVGMLFATVFPTVLMERYNFATAYNLIFFLLIAMLFAAGILMHFVKSKRSFTFHSEITHKTLWKICRSKTHGRFLIELLLNAISTALPAPIALFYIEYVIGAKEMSGYFLLTYFLCGIISIPFWIKYSNANGKKNAWLVSMALSILFFISAFFLGKGDITEFLVVCAITGFCLGADLCLPPSIFADNVEHAEKSGSYFALWNLVNKAALALGAFMALGILGFYGFDTKHATSENMSGGIAALSFVYCLLPCIFRATAAAILISTNVDKRANKEIVSKQKSTRFFIV